MACLIQNAEKKHLAQLENLEKLCFSMPWTREQLESQLPDAQHVFLVAVDGESVLGYVG